MSMVLERIHPEVQGWIKEFDAVLRSNRSPESLVHYLVQMGIWDLDDIRSNSKLPASEPLGWLARRPMLYASVVWSLVIRSGRLDAIRAALEADMRVKNPTLDGFGLIVRHDYGKELLEKFLTHTPDPEWVCIVILDLE